MAIRHPVVRLISNSWLKNFSHSSKLKDIHEVGSSIKSENNVASDLDFTGPPDPISNLRRTTFYVSPDETVSQKLYRKRIKEVEDWNESYWRAHNRSFHQLKEDFKKKCLAEYKSKGEIRENVDADEMSVFYKRFLNENHAKHMKYNREWYKKNVSLLWPALLAFLSSFDNLKRYKIF